MTVTERWVSIVAVAWVVAAGFTGYSLLQEPVMPAVVPPLQYQVQAVLTHQTRYQPCEERIRLGLTCMYSGEFYVCPEDGDPACAFVPIWSQTLTSPF